MVIGDHIMKLLKEMLDVPNVLAVKVKKEFKNKKGDQFPIGATVNCEFRERHVRLTYGDAAIMMPYTHASKYLTKFKPYPSMKSLENMTYGSIATTVIGSRVEPDGHGPYGDPSWLLVAGLI